MAWPALSGQQHRDRRDVENSSHEHLEKGTRQDAQEIQGHRMAYDSDVDGELQ